MKKTNEISKMLVSELIKKRIIDNSAQTVLELSTEWQYARSTTEREVQRLMAAGTIEKVYKKNGDRLVPAYRIKKA